MATVTPKVKFGLRKIHYAKLTGITSGAPKYAKPIKVPGAVSFLANAAGDPTVFYADDGVYYETSTNDGYTGEHENALWPDSVLEDIFKFLRSTDGLLFEDADAEPEIVAILAEFATDAVAKRVCFYNVLCSRPDVSSKTREKTKTPQTEKISMSMRPMEFYDKYRLVKYTTTPETNAEAYEKFFEEVKVPTEEEIKAMLSKISTTSASQGNAIPISDVTAPAQSVTAEPSEDTASKKSAK